MDFGKNDIGYIIDDGIVKTVKVVRSHDGSYFVQRIGACGMLVIPDGKLFKTPEEAKKSLIPEKAGVSLDF